MPSVPTLTSSITTERERLRGAPAPAGFVAPDTQPPVDADAALAVTPHGATVKGVVIQGIVDLARAADALPQDPAFGKRWLGFKDYPLVEYMRVAVLAARALHPTLPLRDGLRAVGRAVFQAFMVTLSGRVLFGVLRDNVPAFMKVTSRAYELTQSHGRARLIESSESHCVLAYTGLYQFLDSLELGVIEAGANACGLDCEILVRHTGPGEGMLLVRLWPRGASAQAT